ncbi:hypothetical protein [Chitinophaga sp. Cy-1792]|uniref:hypothetical protein n=1 Tax=Chitinophaga sp. Cy-1792 TaxID=2608339 RepID=UPI0014243279|nr:hypothetical protein [Chitinophaga sp. Cy-1792]NIG54710.1 hypothetical protein [Chitinophaga sp. Cy-1792]
MKFIPVVFFSLSLIFILNGCTKVSITVDPQLQQFSAEKKSMTLTTNQNGDVYDVIRQHTLTAEFQQDRVLLVKKGIRRMQQLNVTSLDYNQQVAVLGADSLFMEAAYQDFTDTYNYLVAIGKANNNVTGDDLPKSAFGSDNCIDEYNQNMATLTKDVLNYLGSSSFPGNLSSLALNGFKERLIGIQVTYRFCVFFLRSAGDVVGIDPGPSVDVDINLAEAAKAKARSIDQLVINAFESYNLGQLDDDPYPVYDSYTNEDIAFIITQTYLVHFNRVNTYAYSMADIYDYIHANYQQVILPLTRPLPDFMQPHL